MDTQTAAAYLDRIGAAAGATVEELQERQLATVPFENLSIHLGDPILLDEDALVDKIVHRRRGGFCYELNGLFAGLLTALGHDVRLMAARVHRPDGTLGPPFDHLTLAVGRADRLLVDVGFGRFSARPLRFDERGDQHDDTGTFRLVDVADGDIDVFLDDQPQYRIEPRQRRLDDFTPMCWWHETSPQSHFTQSPICSMPHGAGRISLSGDRLIRTHGDERREETILIGPAEVLAAYRDLFGIVLGELPQHPVNASARSGVPT